MKRVAEWDMDIPICIRSQKGEFTLVKRFAGEIMDLFKPSPVIVFFFIVPLMFSIVLVDLDHIQNLGRAILFGLSYPVVAMVLALVGTICFQIMFWILFLPIRLLFWPSGQEK